MDAGHAALKDNAPLGVASDTGFPESDLTRPQEIAVNTPDRRDLGRFLPTTEAPLKFESGTSKLAMPVPTLAFLGRCPRQEFDG